MTVAVACLECGRKGLVADDLLGRQVECSTCRSRFHLAGFLEDLRTGDEADPAPEEQPEALALTE